MKGDEETTAETKPEARQDDGTWENAWDWSADLDPRERISEASAVAVGPADLAVRDCSAEGKTRCCNFQ